jgi:hypothetical protein
LNFVSPHPFPKSPEYTQNAIWDDNDDLLLYQVDGVIYDKNGGVILNMAAEYRDLTNLSTTPTLKGFTEFIFVPVPNSCGEYYGITTYTNGRSTRTSTQEYEANVV